MDIATEIAWDNWQVAWHACEAAYGLRCEACPKHEEPEHGLVCCGRGRRSMERVMRFPQDDDLAASRGILLGVVLGLSMWLLIAAILLVVAE